MERRTLLKTAAAGIGTATIGGAGLLAATGGGAAADGTISIDPSSTTSDDGSFQYISVDYWKALEWTGFDDEVAGFEMVNELTISDSNGTIVDSHPIYTKYENTIFNIPPVDDGGGNPDYATAHWGSADYTTGPGTSGLFAMGIGDSLRPVGKDGRSDDSTGISAQDGQANDWVIVEGSAYDSANDPYSDYGLPKTPVTDHGTSPTTGAVGTLDAPGDDGDGVDNTRTLSLVYEVTFTLYDDSGSALTGADAENGPADPVLDAHFTVDVTNEAAASDSDGTGTSETN